MGRVVLVTGVADDLGGRFATQLSTHPNVDRVIGVDVVAPARDLGPVRFVPADVSPPVIAGVISEEGVDTVVHLGVIATRRGARTRSPMRELDAIGTMRLLAACQQASEISRLVVLSSTTVYGSSPRDPAMFTEETAAKRMPRHGYGKDCLDVEGYVRGFARRRPDVAVAILRCADLLGPLIDTSMSQYLSLPVIPRVLGFDPRLQFCHEDDALSALQVATVGPADGTYNVAGDGVLTLAQVIRRLRRPSISMPLFAFGPLSAAFRHSEYAELSPDEVAYLRYGRGVDTTRMRHALGFDPMYTTAEAFAAFAARLGPGLLDHDQLAALSRG